MLKNNYICALDIGSSKISGAVAKIQGRHVSSIFFESLPSSGIKKGIIVNSVDLIGCISKVLKKLSAKSGINIRFVYADISGQHMVTKHSRACLPLAERGNKIITQQDVEKVREQARILASNLEEEIIHALPFSYSIDAQENILNPLGLYSHKLEMDLYLVCTKLSTLQSLTRVINQSGYEIKDLFFSGTSTSGLIMSGGQLKQGTSIICDIGSDITEVLLFKQGSLRNIQVLNMGGDDLTASLQENLKIPFELAEDIKKSYASVGDSQGQEKQILVKKNNIYKTIDAKAVSEVVTSETKLFCAKLKEAVEKITPINKIDNFSAVGRTVLQEGFLETLEGVMGISVKLGRIPNAENQSQEPCAFSENKYIQDVISLSNKSEDLSGRKYLTFITCIGIICQSIAEKQPLSSPIQQPRNFFVKTVNRFKEVYQEYF